MDYLQQIKQDNEVILKFLLKNQKQIDNIPLSVWSRIKFKNTKSLITYLIKKTKESKSNEFKIGLKNTKYNSSQYKRFSKQEMESLLKSGNLGSIDIEVSDSDSTGRAINKFGKSS